MSRLLLIESSPTSRLGLQRLLSGHGFDVVSAPAGEGTLADIDRELSRDLAGMVLGWTTCPAPVAFAVAQRLSEPDCSELALVILVSASDHVEDRALRERPFTVVRRLRDHMEVPGLMRGLLAQIAREARRRSQPQPGLKVLLVDDSRTSRVKYQRLLADQGHAVVACEDGESALVTAQTQRFDIAVIDYFMPGMSGAMLCRALRELPAARDLMLGVLTGSYEESLISDCLAAGAAECMFKNESDALFLARVQGLARLRERELRLQTERAQLELILSSVGDGVYGVDREGRIGFINPAALRMLKWPSEEGLVGQFAQELVHPADERGRRIPSETSFLQQAYELGDTLQHWETVFWRADGEALSVECTLQPQYEGGECTGVVVAFRDISERKRFEAELQWQLHHDHLTKLHNRRYFEDALEQEFQRLKRSDEQSALLFIDLDRFKQVNDSAGHAAGDALLTVVAQKLKARSRQSDIAARLAGDEFAVLLRNVDEAHVAELADQFRSILDEARVSSERGEIEVSGSVGVCLLDRHTESPGYALNCADAACQIAKRGGRNRVHRFDADSDARMVSVLHHSWSDRLRKALLNGAFALQLQPIVDLRRLPADLLGAEDWQLRLPDVAPVALYGHEVFLRLADADARLAPRAFLSQAERFELLPAIDSWVAQRLGVLRAQGRLPTGSCVHLNVAAVSLLDGGYRDRLELLLQDKLFAPGEICLELKESELLPQLRTLLPILNELHELGVALMLDEYGRGLAGMAQLRRLPLTAVKFDGDLVQTLVRDDPRESLLSAMTEMAHAQQLAVIAPLVESGDVLQLLLETGVDCAQGFALGAPADA